MLRVCAWCGKVLGRTADYESDDPNSITHGMCDDCALEFGDGKEPSQSLSEFLDGLGVPILLIHPEPYVITANRPARVLLGKDLAEIAGRRGGDVIRCAHARRPGGCGQQEHCQSCTIRNTVLDTFATGTAHVRVPAYPDIAMGDEIRHCTVFISTEKVGDVVLLRIDDFQPGTLVSATP